jgi:chromosome segregation ATPase
VVKQRVGQVYADLEEAKIAIVKMKEELARQSSRVNMNEEKERMLRSAIDEKQATINEFKSRIQALDHQLKEFEDENSNLKITHKKAMDRLLKQKEEEWKELIAQEKERDIKKHQEEIDQLHLHLKQEMESKTQELMAARPEVDSSAVEAQVRQRLESEFMERMREHETQVEARMKQAKEEQKKELDRLQWESETIKEDLKRAREARAQIEREAQELLQQAEAHYKNELSKRIVEQNAEAKAAAGIFTKIGRFLDTPIIDTKKKKDGA